MLIMKRTIDKSSSRPLLCLLLLLVTLTSCRGPVYASAMAPVELPEIEQVPVPGGMVTLGSNKEEKAYGYTIGGDGAKSGRWFDSERERRVFVDNFYIDKYPVTQAQYLRFVRETGHRHPFISEGAYVEQGFLVHPYSSVIPYLWGGATGGGMRPPSDMLDHPVVLVSLEDAKEYCGWRSSLHPERNFRVPSEDEWEKAARGADGRYFPWGESWDDSRANIWRSGPHGTTSVTAHPEGQSPYGVHEMAGNIFEWTSTPLTGGSERYILKSCSWDDMPGICRGAARHGRPAKSRHILIGFRCVSTERR